MPLVARKDSTDTITVYPPRSVVASPSAADIRIATPAVAMPEEGSETTLTRDTVSTTLSAAASRDAVQIALTSAVGVTAGRRYLATSNGAKHILDVEAVSGSDVYLTEPLLTDLASGATFVGLASWVALTTAQTANVGVGRVVVRLTLDGVIRRIEDTVRIEFAPFEYTLTPLRALERKEIRRLREATDLALRETLSAAWTDVLRLKLRARGITEHRIRTPSELEPAHIEAVILLLMRAAERGEEAVRTQEERVDRTIADTLASRDWLFEEETSTSAPQTRAHLTDAEIPRLTR